MIPCSVNFYGILKVTVVDLVITRLENKITQYTKFLKTNNPILT